MKVVNPLVAEKAYLLDVLVNKFPTGIVSYVMDSYDYWGMLEKVIPSIKEEIMSRDGKFVVRGDSGNPVDVICGVDEDYPTIEADTEEEFLEEAYEYIQEDLQDITPHGEYGGDQHDMNFFWNGKVYNVTFTGFTWNRYDKQYYYLETFYSDVKAKITEIPRSVERKGTIEALWDIFGGTVNEKGYKVLDSHIGMIYGDGITVERQIEILTRLKKKGFASTNIVFGVGSYSLNMVSRDHLGMAIKATNQVIEMGDGIVIDQPIYKDPKTDTSKKSAHGLISVHEKVDGELYYVDKQNRKQEQTGLLNVLYMNGQFHKLTNIFQIRDKMWSN